MASPQAQPTTAIRNAIIRRGDIIIGVNQERLTSLEQFNQTLSQQKPGSSVALLVRRYALEKKSPEGMLEEGAVFLQKPFSPILLVDVIQEALAMDTELET